MNDAEPPLIAGSPAGLPDEGDPAVAFDALDAGKPRKVWSLDQARAGASAHTPAAKGPRPMDWAALAGQQPPEREWLIEHWLPPQPTLFSGRGGVGKSFLAQMIGTALAVGLEFIAAIPERVNVLMWMCEDEADEIWRRQAAICAHFQIDMAALAGRLVIMPRMGADNTLLGMAYGEPAWTPLIEDLRQQVGDFKARAVFLDNIGHLFGGNESSRHDVTKFVGGLMGVGMPHRAAMVLLGHTAKARESEFAGSTAWENACRMRWLFGDKLPEAHEDDADADGESQDDVRYLCKRKSNYATRDVRRFQFLDGVLVPDETPDEGDDRAFHAMRMRRAENVILAALPVLADKQIHVSEGHSAPSYLPRVIAQYGLSEGLTPAELGKAMRSLIMDGKIAKRQTGVYPNRAPKIGLAVI